MQKFPTNDSPVLKRLEWAFATYRRKHKGGRIRYPSDLKKLATSSISNDHWAAVIARAAGISEQALSHWVKSAAGRPQELKVMVENISASAEPASSEAMLARVHLPSGTTIEVPVLALTPSLIAVFARTEVIA